MLRKIQAVLGGLALAGSLTAAEPAVTTLPPVENVPPRMAMAPPPLAAPVSLAGTPTLSVQPTLPVHPVVAEDDGDMSWGLESVNSPYLTIDYLSWWVKSGPLRFPLVVAHPAGGSGALTDPTTQILLGTGSIDFHRFNGLRLIGGYWLDEDHEFGIEGSYFLLERQTTNLKPFAAPTDKPVTSAPYVDAATGTDTSFPINSPGSVSGTFTALASSRFQGWEVGVTRAFLEEQAVRAIGLFGFRMLDLNEDLRLLQTANPANGSSSFFLGTALPSGGSLLINDRFHTANEFYGGQVGLRLERYWQGLGVSLNTKVGIGITEERLEIQGVTTAMTSATATPQTALGGLRALPTNIGQRNNTNFTVVPEVGLQLSEQLTPWMKVRVGYNFLYWSNVARPAQQMDRTLSTNLIPASAGFGPTGTEVRPAAAVQHTDFHAHGVNIGLEFGY
jgi:hypothetical protein